MKRFIDRYGRKIEVKPLTQETIRRSANRAGIPATAKVTWECSGLDLHTNCGKDSTQTLTYDGMNSVSKCDEHMLALAKRLGYTGR